VTIAGPPEVALAIAQTIARRGLRCRRVELVSPLREQKGVRFAYRVDTEDGTTVKLRHFGSPAAARAHLRLRRGLEDAFAPALGASGAVVLEAWVDGDALSDRQAEARAAEAGALLGRLHARPLAAGVPAQCDTARWRAGAESDLAILAGAGALPADVVAALHGELARRDPGDARAVLLHKDFCAENMLIDGHGRLRVIDNEQLEIGPAGFDLGRTYHRWPMSDPTWQSFVHGYRSAAPSAPCDVGFWRIVAALIGARVFLQRIPARLPASLALLRRLAAGDDLADATPSSAP
jgi:aminoglycoside phosphotransferase (APT) family kinase protein